MDYFMDYWQQGWEQVLDEGHIGYVGDLGPGQIANTMDYGVNYNSYYILIHRPSVRPYISSVASIPELISLAERESSYPVEEYNKHTKYIPDSTIAS